MGVWRMIHIYIWRWFAPHGPCGEPWLVPPNNCGDQYSPSIVGVLGNSGGDQRMVDSMRQMRLMAPSLAYYFGLLGGCGVALILVWTMDWYGPSLMVWCACWPCLLVTCCNWPPRASEDEHEEEISEEYYEGFGHEPR